MTTKTKAPIEIPKHHYWKGKPLPDIFYEDPEPVEDGMLQEETIDRVREALRRRFPNSLVKGGGFIMYDPENGNNRFQADTYISFDINRERLSELDIPNYWTWIVGKMPELALEVASPSTKDRDLDFKRKLYLRLGFEEYWMLDNKGDLYGKPITGLHRVRDRFEEYPVHVESDGSMRSYSELLGLEFWWLSDAPKYDPFDVRDPATGKSICVDAILEDERDARIAAERQVQSERDARVAAERRERELLRQIELMREREG